MLKTNYIGRTQNPLILSKFFSISVIGELAKKGESSLMADLAKEIDLASICNGNDTLATFFDRILNHLQKNYRNEYVYKNTIANKILIGRHSLNTASMHTEFRVGESKADVLILNGTSHIYEIKTELDSLDRLDNQLSDYAKFAEYVSVVTAEKHFNKIVQKIPSEIGIIILTKKGALSTYRKAISGKKSLSNELVFDSLQKAEYSKIILDVLGYIPNVPNGIMYQRCKVLFKTLDVSDSHHLVVECLKQRNMDVRVKEFIDSVPVSLKAIATSVRFTAKQRQTFLSVLNKNISDFIYQ